MLILYTVIQTFSDTDRRSLIISQRLHLLAIISLILMTSILDSARGRNEQLDASPT